MSMSAELAIAELQKAMTFFDTDRQAARQYLTDALVLLGTQVAEVAAPLPARAYQCRRGGLPRWQVQRAHAYIESNLGSKLTVAGIARKLLLSVSHFSRAFNCSMGCPPMAY